MVKSKGRGGHTPNEIPELAESLGDRLNDAAYYASEIADLICDIPENEAVRAAWKKLHADILALDTLAGKLAR